MNEAKIPYENLPSSLTADNLVILVVYEVVKNRRVRSPGQKSGTELKAVLRPYEL